MLAGWLRRWWQGLGERFRGKPESGDVVLWVLRGCFGAIIIGIAWAAFDYFNSPPRLETSRGLQAFFSILGIGALVLATDILVRNKQITTISAVYFGLLLGLLLGTLFSTALEPIITDWFGRNPDISQAVRLLLTVICCYISISTLLQTKDEFRFIIPYVEFSKQVKGARPLVLDTSVIIDGRIADICETGIL